MATMQKYIFSFCDHDKGIYFSRRDEIRKYSTLSIGVCQKCRLFSRRDESASLQTDWLIVWINPEIT